MVIEVYKTKVDAPDELLAHILDAAVCIRKREDKLGRTTSEQQARSQSLYRLSYPAHK